MSKKILIVDDEEGIRESLKLILGEFYELILVEDSNGCMECLEHSKDIGLVLLDIKMPNKNGLEVLKEIKSLYSDIKVIIVTGYKSVELASEVTKHGASGYIIKPFDSAEVLKSVKKIIST